MAEAPRVGPEVRNSRILLGYAFVVALNYVAQVPYALHLYGTRVNPTGVVLLGITLAWFAVAWLAFRRRRPWGFWLLLGYALAQVLFYLNSEVVQSLRGFGLPYHLLRTADPIVWWTFLVGDLNFVAACAAVIVLVRSRLAADRQSPAPRRAAETGLRPPDVGSGFCGRPSRG